MDMCVCENQNKSENSETEKSSNNPLPQNTTDIQIVPPLSGVLLLEICNDVWVWCGGIAHVSARTIYQNQLTESKKQKNANANNTMLLLYEWLTIMMIKMMMIQEKQMVGGAWV